MLAQLLQVELELLPAPLVGLGGRDPLQLREAPAACSTGTAGSGGGGGSVGAAVGAGGCAGLTTVGAAAGRTGATGASLSRRCGRGS